jgi:hypothetical protein
VLPARPSPVAIVDVEAVPVAVAGGVVIVVDAGAARGASGVKGAAWGAAQVVGATRGVAKDGEVGDEGAAQVLAVGLPRVVV